MKVAASIALVTSIALYGLVTVSEARMAIDSIPPLETFSGQQVMVDVATRERDFLRITSHWPDSLTVENISDKQVSGFTIDIFAANDDGGPGRTIAWGHLPDPAKETPFFKPKEIITLPIRAEIVKTFEENKKPFLYIQLKDVWVNNDPTTVYRYGAELRQDPKNPNRFLVVVDTKGRPKTEQRNHSGTTRRDKRALRNHADAYFHITHSVSPPFVLICCNREFYSYSLIDCTPQVDPCDVNKFCYISNEAYTFCSFCCSESQVTSNFPCTSHNPSASTIAWKRGG